MIDNNQTPHLVVDATQPGVAVPEQHIQDGKIVLNISYSATTRLELANEAVSFDARFAGVSRSVYVPLQAVLGIYARETGEGLVFPVDEYTTADEADATDGTSSGPTGASNEPPDKPPPPAGRPSLKIVK